VVTVTVRNKALGSLPILCLDDAQGRYLASLVQVLTGLSSVRGNVKTMDIGLIDAGCWKTRLLQAQVFPGFCLGVGEWESWDWCSLLTREVRLRWGRSLAGATNRGVLEPRVIDRVGRAVTSLGLDHPGSVVSGDF
jgi:hypothetical protein